jgi:hypothetical protein
MAEPTDKPSDRGGDGDETDSEQRAPEGGARSESERDLGPDAIDRKSDPNESDDGGTGEDEGRDEDGEERQPARAPLRADGMERPAFLLDFPEDHALEPLIQAFEAGNYAYVRARAQVVANEATDPAVRDAALELRRRIDPDPLAKYLLAISIGLLFFLVLWTYFASEH